MIRFNPSVVRIFKISVLMMLCCHWMGCTWWLVSELEIQANDDGEGARARRLDKAMLEAQNGWQPPTDLLNDDSLGPQYWRAFFWGAGMVTGFVPYEKSLHRPYSYCQPGAAPLSAPPSSAAAVPEEG